MFASVLPRLRAAASAAQLLPRAGAAAWRAPPLSTSTRSLVSVWQARKAVFDTAMPDVPNHRFKSLQYLKRKGLMGPKARRRRVQCLPARSLARPRRSGSRTCPSRARSRSTRSCGRRSMRSGCASWRS